MLECEAFDFRNGFVRLCYNSKFVCIFVRQSRTVYAYTLHVHTHTQESMKDEYIKNVQSKIKNFATFLGDKQWFIGNEVSILLEIHYKVSIL